MGFKRAFLNKRRVTGVAEAEDGVKVFVTKKLTMPTIQRYINDPESPWTEKDVVPEKVKKLLGKDQDINVLDAGEFEAYADRKKYKPFVAGTEIAPHGSSFVGTAGAVVYYKQFRKLRLIGKYASFIRLLEMFGLADQIHEKPAVLTNAHVTNTSVLNPQLGTDIVHPGRANGSYLGDVFWNSVIKEGVTNRLDASLFDLYPTFQEHILDVGIVGNWHDAFIGEEVMKRGRTTEFTESDLIAKNGVFNINFSGINLRFGGIDVYPKMSNPGDSGSVIVSKENNEAVGLLFAGSSKYTLAIPIREVIKQTGVYF